jgi:type VI secretion system FHA domain protein
MDFMKLIFKIINNPSCGTPSEKQKSFDSTSAVIGRSPNCDWVLPDPDRFISSKHAEINFKNNTFFLKDISSNGTINGLTDEAIGNNQELAISNGQTFLVGDYLIQAEFENVENHDQHNSSASENADWDNQMDDFWGNSSDPLDFLSPNKKPAPANTGIENTPSLANSLERTPAFKQAMSFSNSSSSEIDAPPQPELSSGIPENWDNTSFSFPEAEEVALASTSQSLKKTSIEPIVSENIHKPALVAEAALTIEDIDGDDDFFLGLTEDSLFNKEIPPAVTPGSIPSQTSIPSSIPNPGKLERPASTRPRKRKQTEESTVNSQRNPNDNVLAAAKLDFEKQGFDQALLTEEVASQWLSLMPTIMQSTIELLQARAAIKNEFRVSKTLLTTSENNPLKFSVNAEDAISSLFHQKRPGFLTSEHAFKQAFRDINQHQSALLHGVRVAMMDLLKQFDAEALENNFNETTKTTGILDKFSSTKSSQAKLWQQYKSFYKTEYKVDSDDSFQRIFGETFAEAYDDFNEND